MLQIATLTAENGLEVHEAHLEEEHAKLERLGQVKSVAGYQWSPTGAMLAVWLNTEDEGHIVKVYKGSEMIAPHFSLVTGEHCCNV